MEYSLDLGLEDSLIFRMSAPQIFFGLLGAIAVLALAKRRGQVRVLHGFLGWVAFVFFGFAGAIIAFRYVEPRTPGEHELESMGSLTVMLISSVIFPPLLWIGTRLISNRRK